MGTRTLIRVAVVLILAAGIPPSVRGDDATDRAKAAIAAAKVMPASSASLSIEKACPDKARAEAALGLAKAKMGSDSCGYCRTDLEVVRGLVKSTGKPAILFVGGCDGRGKEFVSDGAFLVRAKSYAGDERGDQKRIVILSRDAADGIKFQDLPADAKPGEIRKAVKEAGEPANPPPAEPIAASPYRTYVITGGSCATGNCPQRK